MSLRSAEPMRTMSSRKSGGEDNSLGATPTPTLLTATNDEWSYLGIRCADERSNTERSTNLCRADHEMRGSDLARIDRVVICGLHRVNNKSSPTRCAPGIGKCCPWLNRAYFP